jgi:hypothetical protein
MTRTRIVSPPRSGPNWPRLVVLLGAMLVAALTGLSAHVVRGVSHPTLSAFVSSPTATQDAPVRVAWGAEDTELRVMCFYVANTSAPRNDDPEWPRITAVGFELPGDPSGFSLLEPLDGTWEIVEGVEATIPSHSTVTLDVALRADVNPAGWSRRGPNSPLGLPPGQPASRGSGTRFCVSGPFPDTLPSSGGILDTTIERLINGIVVGFHRVGPSGPSIDVGVWDSPQRAIPLYPQ